MGHRPGPPTPLTSVLTLDHTLTPGRRHHTAAPRSGQAALEVAAAPGGLVDGPGTAATVGSPGTLTSIVSGPRGGAAARTLANGRDLWVTWPTTKGFLLPEDSAEQLAITGV